jgi:hypothetical protein
LARRLGEGALEGPAQHAADGMWDGVGEKRPAEEVGDELRPGHSGAPLCNKVDDVVRRAGLAQTRKDVAEAILVGLRARVGHGIDGEGDICITQCTSRCVYFLGLRMRVHHDPGWPD